MTVSSGANYTIRPEQAADFNGIFDLTRDAFAPKSFSDGTEAGIPGALRKRGDLALSLVACSGRDLIGHVAFSPAQLSEGDGNWFALGPISVRLDWQRRGVGRALIETGFSTLVSSGASGCVLTGDPAIYGRCGFANDGGLHHDGTPDKYVLWRGHKGATARGYITFAPAFGDPA